MPRRSGDGTMQHKQEGSKETAMASTVYPDESTRLVESSASSETLGAFDAALTVRQRVDLDPAPGDKYLPAAASERGLDMVPSRV
ncbi:hypothetical protein MTO96_023243 [Rhipicephalus appendiculatus]